MLGLATVLGNALRALAQEEQGALGHPMAAQDQVLLALFCVYASQRAFKACQIVQLLYATQIFASAVLSCIALVMSGLASFIRFLLYGHVCPAAFKYGLSPI